MSNDHRLEGLIRDVNSATEEGVRKARESPATAERQNACLVCVKVRRPGIIYRCDGGQFLFYICDECASGLEPQSWLAIQRACWLGAAHGKASSQGYIKALEDELHVAGNVKTGLAKEWDKEARRASALEALLRRWFLGAALLAFGMAVGAGILLLGQFL